MKFRFAALLLLATGSAAQALTLAPEEFHASRQLACVLAQQSLGQLTDTEYGTLTHEVLDGFDESERDHILAKALGYYDGLMFAVRADDAERVSQRLESFVESDSCRGHGLRRVVSL